MLTPSRDKVTELERAVDRFEIAVRALIAVVALSALAWIGLGVYKLTGS